MNKLLKGLAFGTPQTVGVMTIVPLIGEDASERVASLKEASFLRTTDYGTMVFYNQSDLPVILPSSYSVITKQAAQDHGLPFAAILPPAKETIYDSACCIEQTQGGYINGESVVDFQLLPLSIRKDHFKAFVLNEKPNSREFDFTRMWHSISEFQSKLVGEKQAHISYFFTKFVDALNKFNAEFEIVERQRGAVILINEEVVGIEIVPTHENWSIIWKKLIRDCYGAEVVRLTKMNIIKSFQDNQMQQLDLSQCQSLDELEQALLVHQKNYVEQVEASVNQKLQAPGKEHTHYKKLQMDHNHTDRIQYKLQSTENGKNMFEIFETEDEVLYCSMIAG